MSVDLEMVGTRGLSEAARSQIGELVGRYPRRRTGLLPALKVAQAEIGFLPREIVAEVADLVGVSHAAANELATFYSMLHTAPTGQVRVEVCVQLPCAIAGGERLLRQLAEGLGIQPGETTPDGRVTLVRTPECLGACHRAPMCRVNERYAEGLGTPEAVRELLGELAGAPMARGACDGPVGARFPRPSGGETPPLQDQGGARPPRRDQGGEAPPLRGHP